MTKIFDLSVQLGDADLRIVVTINTKFEMRITEALIALHVQDALFSVGGNTSRSVKDGTSFGIGEVGDYHVTNECIELSFVITAATALPLCQTLAKILPYLEILAYDQNEQNSVPFLFRTAGAFGHSSGMDIGGSVSADVFDRMYLSLSHDPTREQVKQAMLRTFNTSFDSLFGDTDRGIRAYCQDTSVSRKPMVCFETLGNATDVLLRKDDSHRVSIYGHNIDQPRQQLSLLVGMIVAYEYGVGG